MSLFKLITPLVFITLLAACGFTPMYGQKTSTGFNSVEISNIPDRTGQYLRNELIDRFYSNGRPSDPRYTLSVVRLNESLSDLDITKTSNATRAQLRIDAVFVLKDNVSGQTVTQKSLRAVTSYNILSSQFTTRVSEQSARENALNDLAQQIETEVALYLNQNRE